VIVWCAWRDSRLS